MVNRPEGRGGIPVYARRPLNRQDGLILVSEGVMLPQLPVLGKPDSAYLAHAHFEK